VKVKRERNGRTSDKRNHFEKIKFREELPIQRGIKENSNRKEENWGGEDNAPSNGLVFGGGEERA